MISVNTHKSTIPYHAVSPQFVELVKLIVLYSVQKIISLFLYQWCCMLPDSSLFRYFLFQSEFIAECFMRRAYLTGFTGSAGTAVVTKNNAAFWTDGRYFLQVLHSDDAIFNSSAHMVWMRLTLHVLFFCWAGWKGIEPWLDTNAEWKSRCSNHYWVVEWCLTIWFSSWYWPGELLFCSVPSLHGLLTITALTKICEMIILPA